MNTQKPRALPGTICPLLRQDVSEVCHTCHLWDKIRVRTNSIPPDEYDHWDCTLRLFTVLMRDIGAATDGVQKATESTRNEMCKRQDLAIEVMWQAQHGPRPLSVIAAAPNGAHRLIDGPR